MTVINKSQSSKFPNSNANSDTESLNLGSAASSDVESLHNEPTHTRLFRQPIFRRRVQLYEENPTLLKHSGKRKLRRYHNCSILQTLNESEAEEDFNIIEPVSSPLSRLLEDPVALDCWNQFVSKSEAEQNEITESLGYKSKIDNCLSIETGKPILRISSKIRRTLRIRKNVPLETIKAFEDDVIEFFNHFPQDKYVKYPNTSFDRLLTHAIAQYHCLHSFGDWENKKRKVEVQNLLNNWTPTECYLYELVSELRR